MNGEFESFNSFKRLLLLSEIRPILSQIEREKQFLELVHINDLSI